MWSDPDANHFPLRRLAALGLLVLLVGCQKSGSIEGKGMICSWSSGDKG